MYKRRYTRRKYRRPVRRYKRKVVKKIRRTRRYYNFTRHWTAPGITIQSGNSRTYASDVHTFALDQLPTFSEFINLYDQYRICAVKMKIFPSFNMNQVTGTAALANGITDLGRVWTVIDHDDDTAFPASAAGLDAIREYQNVKCTRGNRIHSRYFKPSCLTDIQDSGGATAAAPKFKQWISTQNPSVPHYAIKIFYDSDVSNGSAFTVGTLRLECKFYLQFKNVK